MATIVSVESAMGSIWRWRDFEAVGDQEPLWTFTNAKVWIGASQ